MHLLQISFSIGTLIYILPILIKIHHNPKNIIQELLFISGCLVAGYNMTILLNYYLK